MVEVIEELPKAIVRRVVKEKLSQCSEAGDMSIHRDALLAFSESARIFIHYLSATANDICKESKRQTLNADDVLKAIEEIEFPEFLGPLNATLEDFRRNNSRKRAGAAKGKELNKKRKEEVPQETGSHTGDGEVEGSDDDADDHDKAIDQGQHKDVDDKDNQDNADDYELQDNAEEEVEEEDADVFEQQNATENEEIHSGNVIEDLTEQDDVDSARNNIRSPQEDADEGNNSKGDTKYNEEEEV